MAAENNIVGEVGLRVTPVDPGFDAGVKKIIDRLEAQSKFKIAADTRSAEQQVSQLASNIEDKVGGAWLAAGAQAAAFAAAIYGVQRAVEGVVNKFGGLFDGLAKARAGFTSILGSTDKANTLLGEIRAFAISSPFVTSELVSYSQQLLGVGKAASTIVPTLKNVGDIVASVGGDTSNLGSILYALTQIQTIGKLTGQDARQLQNQLVPITKYIAEYTKQSVADVKKLQEAGGISADIVFAAIANQGAKVQGALNASVRTVAGAKSVLSDTFTALLQSNAGLQGIFDDIVVGIQGVAAELGKPEVVAQINEAIDAVVKVYETLKPVVAGFAAFGATTGLTFLTTISTVLETLTGVIELFPDEALKAIGVGLAALSILKVPTLLIKYADHLKDIAVRLLGLGPLKQKQRVDDIAEVATKNQVITATQRLTAAEIQAAEATTGATLSSERRILALQAESIATNNAAAATTKLTLLQRARQNLSGDKGGAVGSALSVAAVVGGQILNANTAKTNTAAQTTGTALTGAGIGFQLAGPEGAIAGAALGAVVGFLNSEKAKIKEATKEMEKLGKEHAEAFLNANSKLFETATPASAKAIDKEFSSVKEQIAKNQAEIEASIQKNILPDRGLFKLSDLNPFADGALTGGGGGEALGKIKDENKRISEQTILTKGLIAQRDALGATYKNIVVPLQDAARAADEFNKGAFVNLQGHGKTAGQVKDFDELEKSFRSYGVTAQEVIALGATGFATLVEQVEKLDTVQKHAVVSANLLAAAIKDQKGATAAIYDNQIANLNTQIAANSALEQAKKSSAAAAIPNGDPNARLQAEVDIKKAAEAAETLARGTESFNIDNQIDAYQKLGTAAGDAYAQILIDSKDHRVVLAGEAAALNVTTQAEYARTKAIEEGTIARERQNRATEITVRQAVLAAEAGAKNAGAGLASAIAGGNSNAIGSAQAAADQAVIAAGNAAASQATAQLQIDLQTALTGGFALDSAIVKSIDSQIRLTGETARTAAEAATLYGLERQAAEARKFSNQEAINFLNNLQEGNRQVALRYGPQDAVDAQRAQALASTAAAIGPITAALTDGSTALEKANVLVAANTVRNQTLASVLAETGNMTLALAAAERQHNAVINAATANIGAEVDQVIGLNSQLDTLEGRQIVAAIILEGVEEALRQIAQLELELAKLLGAPGATDIQPEEEGHGRYLASQKAAKEAEIARLTAIANGQLPPDLAKEIGVKAVARLPAGPKDTAAADAADAFSSALDSLANQIQSAADAIAAAADKWTASIKERTKYEVAVSASRLASNAERQVKDLTELQTGLASLRARGVNQSVIDKLGIDNVADTRQVRKLVRASDAELAAVVASVNKLDTKASEVAQTEEEQRQRKTIANAIIDAAKTLGLDKPTSDAAAGLAAQFVIQPGVNAEQVAQQILEALTSGRIG